MIHTSINKGTLKKYSSDMIFEAIGGEISTFGNYIIHAFTSSLANNGTGSFYVNKTTEIGILIIGGGGGGSHNVDVGGGGGAGQYIYSSSLFISEGNHEVLIGSGGNAGSGITNAEGGYNSYFGNITSIGGSGGIYTGHGGDSGNGFIGGNQGSMGGGGGAGATQNGFDRPIIGYGGDGGAGVNMSLYFGTRYGTTNPSYPGWFAGGGRGHGRDADGGDGPGYGGDGTGAGARYGEKGSAGIVLIRYVTRKL
jgi:hypothetical protein